MRFAVRDAARHRTRTCPAVAAVAATVAGVVALGIAGASDAAQNRATYSPGAPMGVGVVHDYGADAATWAALDVAVQRALPAARSTVVRGVDEGQDTLWRVSPAGSDRPVFGSFTNTLGSGFLVGAPRCADSACPQPISAGPGRRWPPAASSCSAHRSRRGRRHAGRRTRSDRRGREHRGRLLARARHGRLGARRGPAGQRRPAGLGGPRRRMPVRRPRLLVDGTDHRRASEDPLSEVVAGIDESASLYVERGYHDNSTRIVLLVLGAIGGMLVLGGTLTATFLALSDARPDFATWAPSAPRPGPDGWSRLATPP